MNAVKAVANGIALLDKEMPGWMVLIEISELDLNDEDCCVLGQVFGSYERGLDALFGCARYLRHEQAQHHGFMSTPYIPMKHLQDAWEVYIGELERGAN